MSEKIDDIIREYIDFVNEQVGVYMDALAGFAGHKVRIERQVHRISKASGIKIDECGKKVVMRASYEDPTQPDVIHSRIIRANDYIEKNSEGGSNEQQHVQAILVFIFTYWEDEIRPRLATSKGVEPNEIRSDIMGDLRILRNAILHSKGIIRHDKHKSLKLLKEMFKADKRIFVPYENVQKIFVLIKQDCARMLLNWLGARDNAPFKIEDIKDIAIQKR
jgi:hypothetical protein